MELKQSTAVSVIIGPFVDATDGKTPETGINVTTIDADLYKGVTKSDLSLTAASGDNDCVHVANGYYSLELTAGNTDTLGVIRISFNVSDAMPFWEQFEIVTANYYNTKYSTDKFDVNIAEISGDSTAADNLELAFDGTGYGFTNCTIPTVTTLTGHTAQSGDSYPVVTNGTYGLSALNTDIDAILTDTSSTLETHLLDIKGTGFVKDTHSLPQCLTATSVTVSDKTGFALSSSQTFNMTGNITGNLLGYIGSLGTTAKSDVNGEVSDVLKTDTISEMSQGAPTATPTFEQAINYLYRMWRNKTETTATELSMYNDAGTSKLVKSTISDDATTFTKGEFISGA